MGQLVPTGFAKRGAMQRDKHKKERMFDSACQAFTEHPLPSAPCLNDSRRWTARCGTASIMLALSPVKASKACTGGCPSPRNS